MNTSKNFAYSIALFFLNNIPLSILMLISIVLVGVFGFISTPKQYNPEVTLPAFEVRVDYPGASASEVSKFVTKELEEKISEIPKVDTLTSFSIDGGVSIVRVEFEVGEDFDLSQLKLFTQLYENIDYKIGNIGEMVIRSISPDDVPILTYGFTSDVYSQNELREILIPLMHDLQTVPGVANIDIHGGEAASLNVVLDSERMKERGVTFSQVQDSITQNIGKRHAGFIKTPQSLHEIEINTHIVSSKEAGDILVTPYVKLSEVSDISTGYREKTSFTQFQSKGEDWEDAIYISIAKEKGKSSMDVAQGVYKGVEKFFEGGSFLSDIELIKLRDDAQTAEDEIYGLGKNLITSIVIVSFVLLLFLGRNPALITAFSIPLTLCIVFFIGYLFDQTINRITLFALILSLGLLVDSATVVIENITRYLSVSTPTLSDDRKEIIAQAVGEVGMGLFLSTLTSVIVFLPMTQITGMMGPYMGPLSFFVPMALIVSLFVAYVIAPVLAYWFFKNPIFISQKLSVFDRLADQYAHILQKILQSKLLQKRILQWTVLAFLVVMSFPIFQIIHFQMLPKADRDQLFITMDMPEGTNFPLMYEVTQDGVLLIQGVDDIDSMQIFVATPPVIDFNGLYRGFSDRSNTYQSTIKINLNQERKKSSSEIAKIVRERISILSLKYENVKTRIVEDPPGPPVESTFLLRIKGPDTNVIKDLVEHFYTVVSGISGVVDVDTSIEYSFQKTIFALDYHRAEEKQVNAKDIFQTLSASLSPQVVAEFYPIDAQEIAFVEVSYPMTQRDELSDLQSLYVQSATGQILPISEFLISKKSFHDPIQYSYNGENYHFIGAEMEGRSIVYAAIDMMFAFFEPLSSGASVQSFSLFGVDYIYPNGQIYRIEWGGEFEMTLENFRDLGLAMMVAFLLIYGVLVAQFRSFLLPLFVMMTVFLAMIGILPGFGVLDFFCDTFFTATGMIGFIALMGIVVNNAIIYLEYVEVLKKRKDDLLEVLVEAGKIRLRPIILTSLTTVMGNLTIASDPVWSGLAWSIIFGLSLSAILTLGIFPLLYFRSFR